MLEATLFCAWFGLGCAAHEHRNDSDREQTYDILVGTSSDEIGQDGQDGRDGQDGQDGQFGLLKGGNGGNGGDAK